MDREKVEISLSLSVALTHQPHKIFCRKLNNWYTHTNGNIEISEKLSTSDKEKSIW